MDHIEKWVQKESYLLLSLIALKTLLLETLDIVLIGYYTKVQL